MLSVFTSKNTKMRHGASGQATLSSTRPAMLRRAGQGTELYSDMQWNGNLPHNRASSPGRVGNLDTGGAFGLAFFANCPLDFIQDGLLTEESALDAAPAQSVRSAAYRSSNVWELHVPELTHVTMSRVTELYVSSR